MIQRMVRASSLDVSVYEEVEHDQSATMQAFQVMVLVSILAGIGQGIGSGGISGLLLGVLGSLAGWALWSFLTYMIGTRIFSGTATYGELLRTIGFANAPGVFLIFSFIPLIGGLIVITVAIWTLISGVLAVRQALDISTVNAIITCGIGWLVKFIIFLIIGFFAFIF